MSSTLKAEHLAKKFRKRAVVKDVSLEISQGEVVGLLGPNGAGKTTSFYMLVGIIPCDTGRVLFDQKDITYYAMHKRARLGLGYLPQEASVFRKLTVEQNVMAVLELCNHLSQADRHEKLAALLDEFNISHLKQTMGLSLSGGERRRLEIARALASEPKFILLDEPFAGVDPISVIDIKRIITHLSERGIGVLITDHNVRETLDICSRAYIVNEGQIIAEGSPQTVLANQVVKDVYLGEAFYL